MPMLPNIFVDQDRQANGQDQGPGPWFFTRKSRSWAGRQSANEFRERWKIQRRLLNAGDLRERIFAALTPKSRSTNALIRKAPIVRPPGRYVRGRISLRRNKADRLVKTPKQGS